MFRIAIGTSSSLDAGPMISVWERLTSTFFSGIEYFARQRHDCEGREGPRLKLMPQIEI